MEEYASRRTWYEGGGNIVSLRWEENLDIYVSANFCKIFRLLNIKPRLMLDLIYGKSGWGGNTHKRIVAMKQSVE